MQINYGNYDAFVNAMPACDNEERNVYIVGAGIAGLAAAVFLLRDAKIAGKNIHIFDGASVPGGAMDAFYIKQGYIIRGGYEMEYHFETMWDLLRSIPSAESPEKSVLDEIYRLNQSDPGFSYARIIERRGRRVASDGRLLLSARATRELLKLILMNEQDLQDVKINQVFGTEFFESNFWLYWSTMFVFMPWSSAMEMRRYLLRFIHLFGNLSDMTTLQFLKYNQYESIILPIVKFLEKAGVSFHYGVDITNVVVDATPERKVAKKIEMRVKGYKKVIKLNRSDFVFVTNGSLMDAATYGDNDTPPEIKHNLGRAWNLWKNIATQSSDFGRPEKFYDNISDANWKIGATITLVDERVVKYIEKICNKNPYSGSIVSSGPVSVKDSNWGLSFCIPRQPYFKRQKQTEIVTWVYGLRSDTIGNYVRKKITACSGAEICAEWLYHIGVPETEIDDITKKSSRTIPCYMPYISTYFRPRAIGDRPNVIPKGSVNFAFIGNYTEMPRDTVFTSEYSVRSAMCAVYKLFDIKRAVPEVFPSCFDLRVLLRCLYYLTDKKKLENMHLPWFLRLIERYGAKHLKDTYVQELFKDAKLV